MFHTPLLPELLWRTGLAKLWPSYLQRVEEVHNPHVSASLSADGQHGVKLYRANFIRSLLQPRQRPTSVPVQLIVPTEDRFVRPQLFDRLQHWAPKLWRREVRAGHWQLLAEPQMVTAIASPALREENSSMPIQATPASVRPIQTPLPNKKNRVTIRNPVTSMSFMVGLRCVDAQAFAAGFQHPLVHQSDEQHHRAQGHR